VADTEVELGVNLQRLAEICHRYGIARMEVFGSAAEGRSDPAAMSICSMSSNPALASAGTSSAFPTSCQSSFERPVDLVSRRALHVMLRPRVLHDAKVLYAA
jgi:predicted nucleotidyltransferase